MVFKKCTRQTCHLEGLDQTYTCFCPALWRFLHTCELIELGSAMPGRVREVMVKEGDDLRQDQQGLRGLQTTGSSIIFEPAGIKGNKRGAKPKWMVSVDTSLRLGFGNHCSLLRSSIGFSGLSKSCPARHRNPTQKRQTANLAKSHTSN